MDTIKSSNLPCSPNYLSTKKVDDIFYFEISKYHLAESIDKTELSYIANKLKIAFPSITKEFMQLLIERVVLNKFTSQKFNDAVLHVIENYKYPNLTIADIISYDVKTRIKLLDYYQLLELRKQDESQANNYISIDVGESKPLYTTKESFKKYNLKKWVPKK